MRVAHSLSLSLLLLASRTLWAGSHTWTSIGPDGGDINALAIDPQSPRTIYAATAGGLSKSTNGGESWKALSFPATFIASSLAIDPLNVGTVYAATLSGMFKTTDGGTTWMGPQIPFVIRNLSIAPATPTTVFAAGTFGIYKTTDGGTTWSAAFEPPIPAYSVAIDPHNSTTVYAGTRDRLLKTTDGGTTWSPAANPSPYPVFAIAIDPQNPNTLYATDGTGGLFKSTNGGMSWSQAGLPRVSSLSIDQQHPSPLSLALQVSRTASAGTGKAFLFVDNEEADSIAFNFSNFTTSIQIADIRAGIGTATGVEYRASVRLLDFQIWAPVN